MIKGVLGQFNLAFAKLKGILQKDDGDDGVLQVQLLLQTDVKVKSIHEDGVVTKLK